MNKKTLITIFMIVFVIIVIVASIFLIHLNHRNQENTDAQKFSEEYTQVDKNNVYVYRTIDEIINILEKGTGIVYLGFPECQWCQRYTKYLNEVAQDMGLTKIYYYNIREDRANNSENYLKIVEILKNYLQFDEEGNSRIYVPSVIAVKKGEIVGFDDETAWDTKGFSTPDEYWNDNEVQELKTKLEIMISDTDSNMCTECE